MINKLLNSPDPEIQSWTEDFDWVFLPVLNPDGLVYSHERDRMWRKVRFSCRLVFESKFVVIVVFIFRRDRLSIRQLAEVLMGTGITIFTGLVSLPLF